MDDIKTFRLDHFLGLNESADGATELKLGEASKMVNWEITPHRNIRVRKALTDAIASVTDKITAMAVFEGTSEYYTNLLLSTLGGQSGTLVRLILVRFHDGAESYRQEVIVGEMPYGFEVPLMFPFDGTEYIITPGQLYYIEDEDGIIGVNMKDPNDLTGYLYKPVILTGGDPRGGGTSLEPFNMLTPIVRLLYSGDGGEPDFQLPDYIADVKLAKVDNKEEAFTYDAAKHFVRFTTARPPEGVNNIEFVGVLSGDVYNVYDFFMCRYHEHYNGATDSRVFIYGGEDNNICYYTGTPAFGKGLYFPAENEIALNNTLTPITGMMRKDSRLIAFKTDGAYTIQYQPKTLADGTVIGAFTVHGASEELGNDMPGQVCSVSNNPRTLSNRHLYDWKSAPYYNQDGINVSRVSERVQETLKKVNPLKAVAFDDNSMQTYYLFLNDEEGTVLVNNYGADAWTTYKSPLLKNVSSAVYLKGHGVADPGMLIAAGNRVLKFTDAIARDSVTGQPGAATYPIVADWESGYMAFGADYLRKYSSILYLSLLPDPALNLEVTASTDRRENYLVKVVTPPVIPGSTEPSPLREDTPKLKRVKLKIKKFTVYKLKLRVHEPDAKATVLGCDMQVRYSSYAK